LSGPKLSYSLFKQWYIFGRSDTPFWYNFISKAGAIHGLIEAKVQEISKILLQVTSETQSESGHKGKIDIKSTQTFTEGFRFGWNLLTGQQFDTSVKDAPYTLKHSPLTLSLEIGVKDPSQVDQAVALLNQFKEMGKSMVPQAGDAVKMGLDIQFRLEGNRFFFDFVVSGLLGGVIQATASKINFEAIKYAGLADFHISSHASPVNVVTENLDQLVQNALLSEIIFGGEVVNTPTVLRIVELIFGILNGGGRESKNLATAINFINAFTYTGLDIQYNHETLFNAIKNTINARSKSDQNKWATHTENFQQTQGMIGAFIGQGQAMATMVADYIPLIKNLDLDRIYLHVLFPVVRTSFKFTLHIGGLTDFINTNFLG
jgi:hypothetical protein